MDKYLLSHKRLIERAARAAIAADYAPCSVLEILRDNRKAPKQRAFWQSAAMRVAEIQRGR